MRADDRVDEAGFGEAVDRGADLAVELGLAEHVGAPPAPITSVFLSSSRLTLTSGIEPPVKPTTTRRPPSRSERRLSVKRSPPTGSSTRSTPPPESSLASSFHGAVGAHDLVGAGVARDALLLVGGDDRDRPRAEALGDLERGGADAAGGAVHEHRLALGAAARACTSAK